MCQWGAMVMADKGKSYRNILAFYFPRARLSRLRR
jgi:SpoIID/LytB domain protein